MFEIKAIVRPDRKDAVIDALHQLPDMPGLTTSVVEGVGRESGASVEHASYGRTPMVKIEIVLPPHRLQAALDTIAAAARTGRAGDGKIFVFRVEDALRVRTGESGLEALR